MLSRRAAEVGAGDPARRPRALEIEAARERVHVERLARDVEARRDARLHRAPVDLAARDAARGHELLAERPLPRDLERRALELVEERLHAEVGDVAPAHVGGPARRLDTALPEPAWDIRSYW